MKLTFEEWEKERGTFYKKADDKMLEEQLTEAEFIEKVDISDVNWTGVSYKDRVQFLTANGYEVTRENLFDRELSARSSRDLEE